MIKLTKLLLLAVSTICTAAAPLPIEFGLDPTPVSPHPGAIFASLRLSSLNNILQLMAPLLANEILQGKEIELNVNKTMGNMTFDLKNATIVTVSGDFQHSLTWKENTTTPTVYLDISGFDINGTVDGSIDGIKIPALPKSLILKAFDIMNITIQIELALPQTEAKDGVHFQIQGHPNFNLGGIQLDVKELRWQVALNKAMPTVVKGVNYALNMAQGVIEGLIWGVNQNLNSTDSFIGLYLIKSLPALNITASRAPELNPTTDLINIWLDGRFQPEDDYPSEPVNDVEPVRTVNEGQFEQIFIHQSMLSSLLQALDGAEKTIKTDANMRAQLLQIFYELGVHYGTDVEFDLVLRPQKSVDEPVQFSTTDGIVVGGMPSGWYLGVDILCSNATIKSEKAVTLYLNFHADINAAWNNFKITAQAHDESIFGTRIWYDLVGLDFHNFDAVLNALVKGMVDDFNIKHTNGIDLVKMLPTLKFISGMAQNSIVSPFVQDQFAYAGFKWISDFGPTELTEQVATEFVQ